jgi:hypothetical protein
MTKRVQGSFQLAQLILLGLLTTGTAYAQSASAADSGVEILKLKWEKQVRLPRNYDPSVIPDNGVFSSMQSRTAVPGSTQAAYGDEARRDAANRSAALAPVDYFPNAPSRLPISYLYSLTIRNAGARIIKAVAWDYVFVSPTSQTVVGNHQLLSYRIVHPGESVTLKGLQRTRPITVVVADAKPEKHAKNEKPLERATIQCVLYDDDTAWQTVGAREGVCELLKNHQPVKTNKSKDQASKSD